MSVEKIEVLVVGGGQAGVAMSEHLGATASRTSSRAAPHRRALAHRAMGLARRQRPGLARPVSRAWSFDGDPEAFAPKETVADYFVAYAEKIGAPIRCGVEVHGGDAHRRAARISRRDVGGADRGRHRGRRHRPVPAPGLPADRPRGRRGSCRSTRPTIAIPTSCPRARCWWSALARRGRRSPRSLLRAGSTGLPLDRAARPAAAALSRARQRLVARRAQQVGHRGAADDRGTSTFAVSGADGGHTVDFRRSPTRGDARRPDQLVRATGC